MYLKQSVMYSNPFGSLCAARTRTGRPLASWLMLLLLFSLTTQANATSILIGAPGNPNDGDCAPFGCASHYQQVYGAPQFPGSITISSLTFFNNNFVPGSVAAANYSIYLSTTPVAVNALDPTFANNLGSDNALFFSGTLGGLIGAKNEFTITGVPFPYNPSSGNLLLTVVSDGIGLEFSVFLDFLSSASPNTFSRAYSFDLSGVATNLESNTGLVTRFADTASTSVPEPGSTFSTAVLFLLFLHYGHKRRSNRELPHGHGLQRVRLLSLPHSD